MKTIPSVALFPLLSALLVPASSLMAATPYPAQVRPGFMSGGSDGGTDANLDLLVPVWGNERRLLFVNPNVRIDDNDGNEQNLGLGFRGMTDNGRFILGGNLFLDSMRSEYDQRYNQWGIGAEMLSHWIDLRANYYNPFGDTENVISGNGVVSGYFFSGHSVMASGGSRIEEALQGIDAEASVLVPGISDIMETRLAATYYNFNADHGPDLDGWRGRVEIRPVKAINLSLEYRDDDVRGGDTFIGGYLEIPLSLENLFAGKNPFTGIGDALSFGKGVRPLTERMTDKVIRDRHVVTKVAQTGGSTGQTVVNDQMLFVNQDNPNQGDGTYENPYQALAQAVADPRYQPGAWIYVFSTDSTADTYAYTGITLLDNMVFWGQGYTHPTYGLGGGSNPILDGGGEFTVITLANNNEVMGFTVQNGFEGIRGSNIKGTNIHDNIIRNNSSPSSGIHIYNYWAPAEVDGQSLTFRFTNNQILDNLGDGIYLYNRIDGGGKLDNTSIDNIFTDNLVQGNSGQGIFSYIYRYSDSPDSYIAGGSFTNTFSGNIAGGSQEGQGNGYSGLHSNIEISLSGIDSPITNTTLISRYITNTVLNNGGYGISDDYLYVYTGGANSGLTNVRLNRYIEDNEIRGNTYDGYAQWDTTLRTWGANSPIANSSINSQLNGNTIADNGQHAIDYWGARIITQGTGSPITNTTITNSFSQNQLSVTSLYNGIDIYTTHIRTEAANSSLTNVSIDNVFTANTIDGTSTGYDGILIDQTVYIQSSYSDSPISNGRITNSFTDNTVTNFIRNGFSYDENYIRTGYNGDSTNSPISNSTINNILTNNTVTDNGYYGIRNWRNQIGSAAGVSSSSTNNTYTGNTVDRNGRGGIYIDEDFSGGANTGMHYTFTNNRIRDNGANMGLSDDQGNGLYMYIDPSNGNLINKTVFMQGNIITGNHRNGLDIYVNGTLGSMLKGDLGGGALSSTGGNTFSGNQGYDISNDSSTNMDIRALNNTWTNNADPESTIYDHDDSAGRGDVITSQNL